MQLGDLGRARDQGRAARAAATTRGRGGRRSSAARARISSASTATRRASRSISSIRGARRSSTRSLARADVVVENFRPGTMERLGLGYDDGSRAASARSSTARSPASDRPGRGAPRPGYDAMMQAEGGLMSITGAAGGPPFRLGVAIADIATGMFAVQGILAALYARERLPGGGQRVGHRDARRGHGAASPTRRRARSPPARRRRGWATGIRRSRRMTRSRAADGDFVLAVGNDDQFRRASRGPRPPGARAPIRASATNRIACATTTRCAVDARRRCSRRGRAPTSLRALTAAGVPERRRCARVTEALARSRSSRRAR